MVATRNFFSGDIVCDYHGKVIITASEGRAMMEDLKEEAGYLCKSREKGQCIDAQTFPCSCHPLADTSGRRINHSSKSANIKPFCCKMVVNGEDQEVVLFKACQNIPVDQEYLTVG